MEAEIVFVGRLTVTDDREPTDMTPQTVIESAFERTMEELIELGTTDPSVSGSCETGEIRISVLVVVSTDKLGVAQLTEVDGTVRAALHAAGVGTQKWNDPDGPSRLVMIGDWEQMIYQKSSELIDA